MNFRQLEYIIAVQNQGHFGRAADECDITQATLSVMVKRLEDELSITIFDRSRSPILPTEEGTKVLTQAREILNKKNRLGSLRSSLDGNLSGELKIGIIPTVAPLLLPIVLKPFVSNYSGIKLSIIEATTDQLMEDLQNGIVDGAIIASPLDDEDTFSYPLYSEELMVYGVQDPSKTTMSHDDLKNSNIWLLEEGHCLKDQVVATCGLSEKQVRHVGLDIQCSSFTTLVGLVDDFGGYTLLPELYVKIMSHRRRSLTRSLKKPEPLRQIDMVVHRPFVKKTLVDAFIATIRNEMAKK